MIEDLGLKVGFANRDEKKMCLIWLDFKLGFKNSIGV